MSVTDRLKRKEKRHAQTEFDDADFERLKSACEEDGVKLAAVLRAGALQWLDEREQKRKDRRANAKS